MPVASRGSRSGAGFTLFEVAVSLGLLAVGVTGTLLLFPVGIRAQQLARFRLYAAAKAEEMVDCFATVDAVDDGADQEAFNPWDVAAGRRGHDWDLELRCASHRSGIMPLPPDIARRLDSDGDEIRALLDQGACLYYAQPQATTQVEESALAPAPANETQQLVFAVSGYAQQNQLPAFTWKSWPYYAAYPSPPVHSLHFHDEFVRATPPANDARFFFHMPGYFAAHSWEVSNDPNGDMKAVFNGTGAADAGQAPVGYLDYGIGYPASGPNCATEAHALRYLQAALWYCASRGLDASFWAPADPAAAASLGFADGTPDDAAWEQVDAMRFLAHASACMTRWKTHDELTAGVDVPSLVVDDPRTGAPSAIPSPALRLTEDLVRYHHERCLRLAMTYAANLPYDWGAPRPAQRAIMMDRPLVQLDPFPDHVLSGTHWNTAFPARQWPPVAAQPITNLGVAMEYPALPLPPPGAFWGDPAHFTLAKPFAATERCREIVFWAVDWQSYEDFETAPSAPVDASRYPVSAPSGQARDLINRADGAASRMVAANFLDWRLPSYRNPEKTLLFTRRVDDRPAGADVTDAMMQNNDWDAAADQTDGADFAAPKPDNIRCFSGRFGADRNFNRRLDRGPLPASARLRATLVARFAYYDPRVPATLR